MGDKATVEVIATFLPQVVVESLLASLERADLTMEALTLEPIAAIHVLIPDSMRRLNIALVDIGAGTSDVAITKRSEEHTSELQSRGHLVCRLLLEKKK